MLYDLDEKVSLLLLNILILILQFVLLHVSSTILLYSYCHFFEAVLFLILHLDLLY